MNDRPCRLHCFLDGRCILCGVGDEHRGLDQSGVMRACIQEIHFCWGAEDNFAIERRRIAAWTGR